MLHFVFELHQLLRQRDGSDGRGEADDLVLIGVGPENTVGVCSTVFDVLRETKQPVQSLLLPLVLNFEETVNCGDYGFYLIALGHFAGLHQDEVSEFLGERTLVFAEVLDHVEFSGEFNDFFHKGVMLHALLFGLAHFVSLPDEQSQNFKGVLKLSPIMHISECISFVVSFREGGVFLHDKIE